jgi:hypothetical protein
MTDAFLQFLPAPFRYAIPSQSAATHEISVPQDWTFRRLRNTIAAREHIAGFCRLCVDNIPLPEDALVHSIPADSLLTVAESDMPRNVTSIVKLRERRTNRYYFVTAYIDETVGDVKSIIREKYFPDLPAEARILIAPPTAAEFPDDEPLWHLNFAQVFTLSTAAPGCD